MINYLVLIHCRKQAGVDQRKIHHITNKLKSIAYVIR